MPRAFIIRPFGMKRDSAGKEIDFDRTDKELIRPALEELGMSGSTTGEIVEAGNIRSDMFALLVEADVVVCDMTILNANVFYELGIRHALRKKHTVLLRGRPTADTTPFDLLTDRYLEYPIDHPATALVDLVKTIDAGLKTERETDSPIFRLLPSLPEADPGSIVVVPEDFREEVDRAKAARSKGWLRLLAEDITGRRFESEALPLIAKAQWDLEDYDGARRTWESIRDLNHGDVDANLALANVYERLSKASTKDKADLLERSNQAIARALMQSTTLSTRKLAETRALQGRNLKTLWRQGLARLPTVEARRGEAISARLKESYEAYRDAFREDLNHFYSGVAALQMGHLLLDLSSEASWFDIFPSDADATRYKAELHERVPRIEATLRSSLERVHAPHDEVWAKVTEADLLFLTSDSERRVVKAYSDAIGGREPFVWNAARGQLDLFCQLGFRSALAKTVIDQVEAALRIGDNSGPVARDGVKPLHLILFAGHPVDDGLRETPRFPGDKEVDARALIEDALASALEGEHRVEALASCMPGADILFHELCDKLKIPSKLALPMPADAYAAQAFTGDLRWRSRFLDLQTSHDVLELSAGPGLPNWLHGAGVDPWERGNRWVIQMALSSEARRITLVAFWDHEPQGAALGGTAHIVELAKASGRIRIVVADARKLITAT